MVGAIRPGGDARTRAILRDTPARHVEQRVPAVALGKSPPQGTRGPPVNWVLKAVGTAGTPIGCSGGTGGTNTADALVAVEALATLGSTIVTSDP